MASWTTSHDVAYCFLCLAFIADGDVDDKQLEAIRGRVRDLLPELSQPDFEQVMKDAVGTYAPLNGDARTRQYERSLIGVRMAFDSQDRRFEFVRVLVEGGCAHGRATDRAAALVERALAALDLTDAASVAREGESLSLARTSV